MLESTRRRFLLGAAAIPVALALPAIAAPIDIEAIARRIDAAIDASPYEPITREERWAIRSRGGWETSADVLRYRATGKLPWEA